MPQATAPKPVAAQKAESQAWIDAVRKSTSLIHIRMGDLLGEGLVKRLEFR